MSTLNISTLSKVIFAFFVIQLNFYFNTYAQLQSNYPCYAIATNGTETDSLFKYINNTGFWMNLGALENVNIKAMAIDPFTETIYATSGPVFGIIDTVNVAFKSKGVMGAAYEGEYGNILIEDITGLAFDTSTKRLFGINRITNQTGNGRPNSPDILVELNCTTGRVIKNAFIDNAGNPSDYAAIGEVNDGTQQDFLFNAKDLAFNPIDGDLLIAQDQASPTYLISVDKLDGEINFILMEVPNADVSGLAFTEYGDLIATTINNPAYGSFDSFMEIEFNAGYTNSYNYIDNNFRNYAFHCLDCYVRKPGCYDTLSLDNSSFLRNKYKVNGNVEIDLFVNVDTLNVASASEILLKNDFEVTKSSTFCARIDTTICQ